MSGYGFSRIPFQVKKVKTKHRFIDTQIPCPGTEQILERLDLCESRSMHGQLPIVWDKAENFNVFDAAGNKWIDFTSTIFVANVGHSNPRISEGISNTLQHGLISCYAYGNKLRADYIERLVKFAGHPFEKAFLLSSGTEATEAAMKLMRMDAQAKGRRSATIICIDGNWHGRTLGAQMMSNNKAQKEWVGYQDPNIKYLEFPYPWSLGQRSPEEVLEQGIISLKQSGLDFDRDVAGFMLETFQGWGAIFYPNEFVQAIKKLCLKHDLLLAFDEMQSGFGRTGKKFGYMHYEVEPDLICCGKGMGGGVPLSGVLGRASIMDLPDVGNMSSTHSANPLVCAAGLAVLNEIGNYNLVESAARLGMLLQARLEDIKQSFPNHISGYSCKGLIAALIFKTPRDAKPNAALASQISERCMQKGLLVVHTGRESIKIGPPLTITDEALLEGLAVLKEATSELIAANEK